VTPIGQAGTVLGMIEPTIVEERHKVSRGDLLVLFTDGVTDAPSDQAIGMDELTGLIAENNAELEELSDLIGDRIQSRRQAGSNDDTALLIIRFGEVATDETDNSTGPPAPSEAATAPIG
jgi:serine phosphatase RsbU (regulator of sigma subunit)